MDYFLQNDLGFIEAIAIGPNSGCTISVSNGMAGITMISSDNIQHHLASTNSFELNTATSLSDDSGVPHTNSSISSSASSRIGLCKFEFELAESDGEVSQLDSLDNCSDGGMSAENFNTLKKVPIAPIEPPPEFQDSPHTTLLRSQALQNYALKLAKSLIASAFSICTSIPSYQSEKNVYATAKFNIYDEPPSSRSHLISSTSSSSNSNSTSKVKLKKIIYSPLHHGSNLSTINRPNSRNSLNSRLSSSHNSLSVTASNKVDDSIFITQAMSHDALLGREIIDFYNVPIDSDIYALPVDSVRSDKNLKKSLPYRNKTKYTKNYLNCNNKKRRRNNYSNENGTNTNNNICKYRISKNTDKRHSVPENTIEPMHMTLDEVKQYYHSLYSSSSDSSDNFNKKIVYFKKTQQLKAQQASNNNNAKILNSSTLCNSNNTSIVVNSNGKLSKLKGHNRTKKIKSVDTSRCNQTITASSPPIIPNKKSSQFSINLNLKQKFCSIFRFRQKTPSSSASHPSSTTTTSPSSTATALTPTSQTSTNVTTIKTSHQSLNHHSNNNNNIDYAISDDQHSIMKTNKKIKFSTRALPPLPGITMNPNEEKHEPSSEQMDFATNLEKVKECGWYWGPISSEAAEKILSNEPDGSFIVRDSSDDHYIFSLTFKLSGCIRHVRIEQYQGEFSFGSSALFKSRTITEFIENAVEHSRSGRYLFFLHRRPEHGPMRVQLTNPVSRFRHIQSLQHMCRFVILKAVVRKDLIQTLPLPRRLIDYLGNKNCYSEQVDSDSSQSQMSGDGSISHI